MRILSKATTGAMIAGAALLVAACGGGAANNTANAPVDNGAMVTNEPTMAPTDMNGGMPADNGAMNVSTTGNATTTTTTVTTNTATNGM